jgi:CubicO group peptidase (beta-lactamase class C family)
MAGMRRFRAVSGTLVAALATASAAHAGDLAGTVAAAVDPVIETELAATGTPGAAFVFVHDGKIVYSRGYGVADLETGVGVDPARTVWPIASITKAVTAMAVLQLVDQGRVALDADVNRYLRRLQVPAQGFPPLTLRHLLSHTGGLDELPGRQFDGAHRADFAAFLRGRLLRYRAPGELTAYSTYGILLAAVVLEDVTGEAYEDAVRKRIFGLAGMASARVMAKRGDEQGLPTPYAIEDGRAEAMPYEWYVSTPTTSVVATAEDMGRLLLVHLADGRAGAKQVLSPGLTRAMHVQQATVHPKVPGWSLGMQMDRVNDRDVAEHGGDIGGFAALFALLPGEDAGFFIVHHGEGSDLRFKVKEALIDRLYPPRAAPRVPTPKAGDVPALQEYAGEYLSSFACRSCASADAERFPIEVRADGSLTLWGQTWVPLERDLFVRDDGKRLLGFARDTQGRIVSVSAGAWRVADRIERRE